METEVKSVSAKDDRSVRCDTMDRIVDSFSELRLIPEFDGKSADVVEWIEKFEMVCRLRGIRNLQDIIPLRLTGGAFAVYLQLSETQKGKYEEVKTALVSAFASDGFMAYEEFIARRLHDGESVDVYLADLRRLATLIGGLPDKALMYAFVAGLPDNTRRLLRAGSRMETMDLQQALARARAVLVEEEATVAAATVAQTRRPAQHDQPVTCHTCNQPNHFARDCRLQSARGGRRAGRPAIRCFRCGRQGHVAAVCQGNGGGGEGLAPPSSPGQQQ